MKMMQHSKLAKQNNTHLAITNNLQGIAKLSGTL